MASPLRLATRATARQPPGAQTLINAVNEASEHLQSILTAKIIS